MNFNIENIELQKISNRLIIEKQIDFSILRLDKIHDDVSGNKIFKLHYFLEECLNSSHKKMLTFGGAYSNHLVATAFICQQNKMESVGIVRGEEPKVLSHTLERCKALGMQLHFINRTDYKNFTTENFYSYFKNLYGECIIVPEGGFEKKGADGASLIMNILKNENPTYICTAVGTATTVAGLLQNNFLNTSIIAVPVIKNMKDIEERIFTLIEKKIEPIIWEEYHFGGYAKYDEVLINFMNEFYTQTKIPLDFVYTAKMMYGMMDKIKNNYFEPSAKIICLHTGGLQGNKSLPASSLIY